MGGPSSSSVHTDDNDNGIVTQISRVGVARSLKMKVTGLVRKWSTKFTGAPDGEHGETFDVL